MRLQDILAVKGTTVFTTSPEVSLAEAVRQMVEHNIGSMLVCQRDLTLGERLVGIVTERDMLRFFAAGKCDLTQIRVAEVMTVKLITAKPTDSVADLMGVMTTHRIRHVPIMSGERLVGMVSIGDLLKAQHDHLVAENQFMRDYIQS
ncbi:MAG: CBS domain-containing protein [Thermoguttaceae bacterium]|jgi:CBS domain-containing protein